jgi:hypothetical protein
MANEVLTSARNEMLRLAHAERTRMMELHQDETLPSEVRSALIMGATTIDCLSRMLQDAIRYGETIEGLHAELVDLIQKKR